MEIGDRASGWSFSQADHTTLRATVSPDNVVHLGNPGSAEKGFHLEVQAPPAAGQFSSGSESEQVTTARLNIRDDKNGATFKAKTDGSIETGPYGIKGDVKLESLGAAKDGQQSYRLSMGDRTFVVQNNKGKLGVQQDQGVSGKKDAGDFAITTDKDGALKLDVVDQNGKPAHVTDMTEPILRNNIVNNILALSREGKHPEALALYKDFVENGYVPSQDSTTLIPDSKLTPQETFKSDFKSELLEAGGMYMGPSGQTFDKALLTEMGFNPKAAEALVATHKYETGGYSGFSKRKEDGSGLQILSRAYKAAAGDLGGFVEAVNSAAETGTVDDMMSAAKEVYEDQARTGVRGFERTDPLASEDERSEAAREVQQEFRESNRKNFFILRNPEHAQEVLKAAANAREEMDNWDIFVDEGEVEQQVTGLPVQAQPLFAQAYNLLGGSTLDADLKNEGDFSKQKQEFILSISSPFGGR